MYYTKLTKWIASCVSAVLLIGSIGTSAVTVRATTLENDSAIAGMAVSLNNYYANNESPEADILNYLKPMVGSSVETEATTAGVVNVKVETNKGSVNGTASAEDLIEDGAAVQTNGIVSTINRLHMRKAPSTNAPIVAYLYSNCKVDIFDTVVNDEATWYLVRSNGIEGYISAAYVLTGAQADAAEESIQNRYATVLLDELEVYNTAGSGGTVVGKVYKDEVYGVMEAHGDYVKIRISENNWGYVRRDGVKINTQFGETLVIDDEFIKKTLNSYITETDDAKRIYDERVAARDYISAKSAIEYAIEIWNYYIKTAEDAGLTDLVAAAKVQRADAEVLRDSVTKIIAEIEKEAGENVIQPANPQPPATQAPSGTQPPATQPSDTPSAEVPSETQPPAETPTQPSDAPSAEAPTETQPPATEDTSAAQKVVVKIVACYDGGVKYAGDVIYASELYLQVEYSDGTTGEIRDPNAWYSPEVGMLLAEGMKVVTMYYGDNLRSAFELNILPAQTAAPEIPPAADAVPPTPTEPAPTPTEPAPVPTEPAPVPTQPAPTEPPATQPPVTEAPKSVVGIEAYYNGFGKTAGELLYASELFILVTYSDGSVVQVSDPGAWHCPQAGMTMQAGMNVITIYYGDFSSSFELYVQPAATEPAPAPTQPAPAPTEPAPAPTQPAPTPTEPAPAPTQPAPVPPQDTAISAARQQVVNTAAYWVGKCNYVYGANNLTIGGAVDCSAFTMNIFATVGVSLPRNSGAQFYAGTHISYEQLRPGDLVCYSGHVAIYIGNGTIIHAKNANAGIVYDNVFFSPTQPPIGYVSVLP